MAKPRPAPDWQIAHWLNAPAPLEELRGKVVLAVAFQMLCPACVSHGLPQALRARDAFPQSDLAVIGLHTVFEHHEAQGTRAALTAFLHEYRIPFPVGIDAQDPGGRGPQTMLSYAMRGTPTTLLIDRCGHLRLHKFGHLDDMRLGAAIAALIGEPLVERRVGAAEADAGCDDGGCRIAEPAQA